MEYYLDCKKLNIPTKERMDLLKFRLRLANNFIDLGKFDALKRPISRPCQGSLLDNSPLPFQRQLVN